MGITESGLRILSEEGIISLLKKTESYVTNRIKKRIPNTIYRIVLPKYIELKINGKTAKFHTSVASLGYDFRDDFDSEKHIISSFINDLHNDDVFYDIGANIGLYSAFSGQKINNGKIVAIEPHPGVTPALYRNLQTNCQDFEVVQLAASNKTGFGKMQVSNSTGADIKADNGITVPIQILSKIVKEGDFETPNVAKIDVEGGEKQVLQGLGELISELELMYIEVHHQKLDEFEIDEYPIEDILNQEFDDVMILDELTRNTTVTFFKATSR